MTDFKKSVLPRSFKYLLKDDEGAVLGLMMMAMLSGFFLISAVSNYNFHHLNAQAMQSVADKSAVAGGIKCRQVYLETGNFNIASQQGRDSARTTFLDDIKILPISQNFKDGDLKITSSQTEQPGNPNAAPKGCSIQVAYETQTDSLFGQIHFPIIGSATASGSLQKNDSEIEIDFVIDISSSMSTIANPADRNLTMALTATPETGSDRKNGCIFFCHLRNALLSKPASKRILDIIASKKPTSVEVNYKYESSLNPGKTSVTISPPPHIKSYRYVGKGTKDTPVNSSLVSLRDMLQTFDIKLKTDQLFSSIQELMDELKSTPEKQRIRVAFHNFENDFHTFIPKSNSSGSQRETVPLNDLTSEDLDPINFEYAVAKSEPNFFSDANDKVYAPLLGSSNSDSIARPTRDPHYAVSQSPAANRPDTYIERALKNVLTKITSRPASQVPLQRVIILITDGLEDLGGAESLMPLNVCKSIKDEGIILMIIHPYYRLQPGNPTSNRLKRLVTSTALPDLTVNNIDSIEKQFNELGIRDLSLLPCASRNHLAQPEEFQNFYFPANDLEQLRLSFKNLLTSILSVQIQEKPVVLTH
jgi:hypothetical protein